MDSYNKVFGILMIICGMYCFYACYRMKKTGEINKTILMSKDMNSQQCKDKAGYIKEAIPNVIALGISTFLSGVVDLFNYYVVDLGHMNLIILVAFFVVLIVVGMNLTKIRKKYY